MKCRDEYRYVVPIACSITVASPTCEGIGGISRSVKSFLDALSSSGLVHDYHIEVPLTLQKKVRLSPSHPLFTKLVGSSTTVKSMCLFTMAIKSIKRPSDLFF